MDEDDEVSEGHDNGHTDAHGEDGGHGDVAVDGEVETGDGADAECEYNYERLGDGAFWLE